jgi:hypothetical protein
VDTSLPPRDVAPERLFRLLLRRPRPLLPLTFRLPFAPAIALAVQGLTALEDAEVVDVDSDLPAEIRTSTIARRLIAATLLADGSPAFASAEDVGALTASEVQALSGAVFRGLHVVSPMLRSINRDAWHDVLVKGAEHRANLSTAGAIFTSTTTLVTPTRFVHLPAPDRYFGLPLADLTDGQLLAYNAARAVFDK